MSESSDAYQNEMDNAELEREFEQVANDIIEEAIRDLEAAVNDKFTLDPVEDYNDFTEAR